MSFESVKKIQHTEDTSMVNAMIEAGWELIGMTPGTTEEGYPWPLYTMGWKKEGDPVKVSRQSW